MTDQVRLEYKQVLEIKDNNIIINLEKLSKDLIAIFLIIILK